MLFIRIFSNTFCYPVEHGNRDLASRVRTKHSLRFVAFMRSDEPLSLAQELYSVFGKATEIMSCFILLYLPPPSSMFLESIFLPPNSKRRAFQALILTCPYLVKYFPQLLEPRTTMQRKYS